MNRGRLGPVGPRDRDEEEGCSSTAFRCRSANTGGTERGRTHGPPRRGTSPRRARPCGRATLLVVEAGSDLLGYDAPAGPDVRAHLDALCAPPFVAGGPDARAGRPRLVQPRGAAHRREPADARPPRRAAPRGGLDPPRRPGGRCRWPRCLWSRRSAPARRCAPRRSCSPVPDGRSVRTLINATPIRADGGEIGSVVVTMQDLAPLDEIERMRAEFLGLVGHELRAPLSIAPASSSTRISIFAVLPD